MEMEIVKQEENLPDLYVEEIEDLEADFASVGANFKDLIERGFDTLDTMKEILESSEHPRAAEVLSNTLKTVADMNKDMLTLHRTKQMTKESILGINKNGSQHSIENQNNQQNIFVGSSADLQKMLKGA